jgi:molybdopterin-guanine dinucleotide biosynthesis protein A
MRSGAIVLAGGRSTRMGEPKATLPWRGTTLLDHVANVVRAGTDEGPVVVVAAAGQALPPLHPAILTTVDARPGRGPLEAIAAGMRALPADAEAIYISSVDAPFLVPAFVRRLLRALAPGVDLAAPDAHGHRHPLCAAYRRTLLPLLDDRLAADELRLAPLLDEPWALLLDETALLADAGLRLADPALRSLVNANDRAAYEAAVAADAADP